MALMYSTASYDVDRLYLMSILHPKLQFTIKSIDCTTSLNSGITFKVLPTSQYSAYEVEDMSVGS